MSEQAWAAFIGKLYAIEAARQRIRELERPAPGFYVAGYILTPSQYETMPDELGSVEGIWDYIKEHFPDAPTVG